MLACRRAALLECCHGRAGGTAAASARWLQSPARLACSSLVACGTARAGGAHGGGARAQASLSEMIPPGALVMLTPVVVGILFGTKTLAGLLAGALVSGVQMAVSMSNTGGAWDNAKKYVEARARPLM